MDKEKTLSVNEICSIIESCGENEVQSFEYLGLKLSFKDKETVDKYTTYPAYHSVQGPESEINTNFDVPDDDPAHPEDVKEAKSLQLRDAMLEDPYTAEQLMAYDGEVTEMMEELERNV